MIIQEVTSQKEQMLPVVVNREKTDMKLPVRDMKLMRIDEAESEKG